MPREIGHSGVPPWIPSFFRSAINIYFRYERKQRFKRPPPPTEQLSSSEGHKQKHKRLLFWRTALLGSCAYFLLPLRDINSPAAIHHHCCGGSWGSPLSLIRLNRDYVAVLTKADTEEFGDVEATFPCRSVICSSSQLWLIKTAKNQRSWTLIFLVLPPSDSPPTLTFSRVVLTHTLTHQFLFLSLCLSLFLGYIFFSSSSSTLDFWVL